MIQLLLLIPIYFDFLFRFFVDFDAKNFFCPSFMKSKRNNEIYVLPPPKTGSEVQLSLLKKINKYQQLIKQKSILIKINKKELTNHNKRDQTINNDIFKHQHNNEIAIDIDHYENNERIIKQQLLLIHLATIDNNSKLFFVEHPSHRRRRKQIVLILIG